MRNRNRVYLLLLFSSLVLQITSVLAQEPTPVQAQRRRRPIQRERIRTSADLIKEAVAAGRLDRETGVLFRVFAAFNDCRLPAEYRGNDDSVFESDVVSEVRRDLNSYSGATKAALAPFLLPPSAPGSWLELSTNCEPPSKTGKIGAAAIEWKTFTSRDDRVKVWAQKRYELDEDRARQLAAEVDSIWQKLAELMGNLQPTSDATLNPNGGDGRLDVYLVHIKVHGQVSLSRCSEATGHVLINSGRLSGAEPSLDLLKTSLAHELMHAFQAASKADLCGEYGWFSEASATWAEHWVFPDLNGERAYAFHFLLSPEKSLEDTDGTHEYGAYLLPFYFQHGLGSPKLVREIWEKAGPDSLVTVDEVLRPWGGFEKVWPEFAFYNWNLAPYDHYQRWDPRPTPFAAGALEKEVDDEHDFFGTWEYAFGPNSPLKHLSAQYFHNVFDPSERIVVFFNGFGFKLGKNQVQFPIDESAHVSAYTAEPIAPEKKKGLRVKALIRGGESWRVEDWTDRPYVSLCRDLETERIDELVVVVTNSEFRDRDHEIVPEGAHPLVFTSPIACSEWTGSVRVTDEVATGVFLTLDGTDIVWRLIQVPFGTGVSPFEAVYGQGTAPIGIGFQAVGGTAKWSVNGADEDCSYTGSGSYQVAAGQGALNVFSHLPMSAAFYRRYFGVHGISPYQTYTVSCEDEPPVQLPVAPWFFTDPEEFPTMQKDLIEGKFTAGDVTWEWSFRPRR